MPPLTRTYLPPDNRHGEGNALSLANIIAVAVVVFILSGALGELLPGAAHNQVQLPAQTNGMTCKPTHQEVNT